MVLIGGRWPRATRKGLFQPAPLITGTEVAKVPAMRVPVFWRNVRVGPGPMKAGAFFCTAQGRAGRAWHAFWRPPGAILRYISH